MAVLSQIEKKLADIHTNIQRKDINLCCSLILSSLTETVKNGSRIELRHFGVFYSKNLKPKIGRNPRTGVPLELKSRYTIRFRASKTLLKRLNEN
tara:strand:- start:618 stop:902 length:285 start_codon:yes stop_codon:yes gene_type:complete